MTHPASGAGNPVRPTTKEIAGVLAFLLATWLAFVILGLGVGSLLLNRDVVTNPQAGVGLGPAMFLGSLVAFAICAVTAAVSRRRRRRTLSSYVGASLICAVIAALGYLGVALFGWIAFVPGNPVSALFFTAEVAIDWPAAVVIVVSFVIALAYFATLAWRTRDTSR